MDSETVAETHPDAIVSVLAQNALDRLPLRRAGADAQEVAA